jgi:simple sugar transport system ATP-binding protein
MTMFVAVRAAAARLVPRLAPSGVGALGAASEPGASIAFATVAGDVAGKARSSGRASGAPLVEVRGITKRFGPVVANRDVSAAFAAGEIHAVLGENGAGKTTLMNILAGMEQPDAGEILIGGEAVTIADPADALRRGIGTVYQHFTLVPNLSILENVALGAGQPFVLDLRALEAELRAMLGEFGLDISPRTEIRHLSLGQRQRVEIAKVLLRGSRVVLLDEPTSVLTPIEVDGLLDILRRLRMRGVAVAIITHKLDEALAVADRVTVLRGGRKVGERGPEELAAWDRSAAKAQVVELMFGGAVPADLLEQPTARTRGTVLLSLRGVSATGDRGAAAVSDLSLDLHAGEIVGIAGVDGNGQKELGEIVAGQRRVSAGQVLFEGADITNEGAASALGRGIGYVTDERLHEGCVAAASVADNVVLKTIGRRPFSNGIWLDRGAIEVEARRLIAQYDVRTPGPDVRIGLLSGGNIQKVLLARELALDPMVLVCNKPTHGLDLKTAAFVVSTLREQADRGKTVLLISSELDEIFDVCDRIGIMYRGRLVAVVPRAGADVEVIGRLMLTGTAAEREAAA